MTLLHGKPLPLLLEGEKKNSPRRRRRKCIPCQQHNGITTEEEEEDGMLAVHARARTRCSLCLRLTYASVETTKVRKVRRMSIFQSVTLLEVQF